MIEDLVLRTQPVSPLPVEIVERKGIGHPDTICDALAETFSRNLCRWYLENTGRILHHNVDKALLRGGQATASFGGGEVSAPIDIYLSGTAITRVGDRDVPIEALAVEGSRKWLKRHVPALDVERHVRIHCLVRQGSKDLTGLFERGDVNETPMANDTSFGVGYAPDTALEKAALDAGRFLDDTTRTSQHPAWGADTKIMAIRRNENIEATVACAMVAAHVTDAAAYQKECLNVKSDISEVFRRYGFIGPDVTVNAADDPGNEDYYLTVSGTSAEAGDDGEVGRGNRASGLITPYRAMSLEAVCGKNPVNHVGKLYNVAARNIAQKIVEECATIESAQCCLVSRIGCPITNPAIADVAISTCDAAPSDQHHVAVTDIVHSELSRLPKQWEKFMCGEIQLY